MIIEVVNDLIADLWFNIIMAQNGKADRLGDSEEAFFIELFDRGLTDGPFLFGRYLKAKGLINDDDIYRARMFQKMHNRKIGEIAVERGMMDVDAVERLLVFQEESGIRFGDLAVSLGYMSQQQLDDVLEHMDSSYVYFGEALVRMGVLDHGDMMDSLGIFQRLRVRLQQMEA